MKREVAIKTTHSRLIMVFKTSITKGNASFCLKCNMVFGKQTQSISHSMETDAFPFTFCCRRWPRYIREINLGENNQGYDDRDGNQNSVAGIDELQLVTVGFHGKVGKVCVRAGWLIRPALWLMPFINQGRVERGTVREKCFAFKRTRQDVPGQGLKPDHYIWTRAH